MRNNEKKARRIRDRESDYEEEGDRVASELVLREAESSECRGEEEEAEELILINAKTLIQ